MDLQFFSSHRAIKRQNRNNMAMEMPNIDPNELKDQAIANAKAKASSMFNKDSILKFLKTQLPMLIVGGLAGYFLPWWATVPVFGIVGAWMGLSGKASFAHGTLAGTSLWSTFAGIYSNMNGGQMATMMGAVLGQGKTDISSLHLIMATGLMGGVLAGLGAWAGSFLGDIIRSYRNTEQKAV
jgi:hypothetical protein